MPTYDYQCAGCGGVDALRSVSRRDERENELFPSFLLEEFASAQARAGAQALQLFDTWAGALAPIDYARFALPYVEAILAELRRHTDIPLIYFANNGATLLRHTTTLDAEVLGVDWRIPIEDAIEQAGKHAIQGNLDPLALFLPKPALKDRILALLSQTKKANGFIFNLGHGIIPETDPDQVKFTVDTVQAYRQESA